MSFRTENGDSADDLRRVRLSVLGPCQRQGRHAPCRRRLRDRWRAIQHDTTIPCSGEPVEGDLAAGLAAEVTTILDLSEHDVRLRLAVPPVQANTGVASAAFAAAGRDADLLRRRLFTAVWAEGSDISDPAELDRLNAGDCDVAAGGRWQREFEALPRPITPTLVLPDGYTSRGLGALARLAAFVADP